MTLLAGDKPTAAELELATEKIIARGRRITSTGTTTTAVAGALRLDDLPIEGGYSYNIRVQTSPRSSVAADGIAVHLRYTTDGTTPSTSSTILPGGYWFVRAIAAGSAQSQTFETEYIPAADETLSLLLCWNRVVGTGNVDLYADSNTHTEMKVFNSGPDVGDTGTDI